jgi:UrcA family protein
VGLDRLIGNTGPTNHIFQETSMNISNEHSISSKCDSGYGKFAAMGLCTILVTIAIAKQLPANAAEASAAATVSLVGLDLSTDTGRQAARDRVYKTAQRLCERVVNPWSMSAHQDYLHCVDDSVADAVTKMQALVLVANANHKALALTQR